MPNGAEPGLSSFRSRGGTRKVVSESVAEPPFGTASLLEERLDEGRVRDLARVDALIGSVDQRLRFLDTDQRDLNGGKGLLKTLQSGIEPPDPYRVTSRPYTSFITSA